jgi:predicted dehydrogenase
MKSTRRQFLRTSSISAAAISIFPRHILAASGGKSPNEKLNIAGIGVGGMGANNVNACSGENIVALCDVDSNYAAKTFAKYPKAKVYRDFREMLDKQKDIDAVIVATPDHTHATIAIAAIRAGKHVYVQKPLAHSVFEARALTLAAREHKVMSQMGNQGHSGDGTRLVKEWIASGVIGAVREVDVWTNRPVWPTGVEVDRPKEMPPVPNGLDWDLWLGPAPVRPYNPCYLPGLWRAWCDFGTGALGDMGCHLLDTPFWALDLKYPDSVEGSISKYWHAEWQESKPRNETYPRSAIIRYRFPGRDGRPPVKVTWWDGGLIPSRPETVGPKEPLGGGGGGSIFHGEKGTIIAECYGQNPRIFPVELGRDLPKVPQTLERVPGGLDGHEKNWIRACKEGKSATSDFSYSGPLSEMVLMGNLAARFPERQLLWDGEKMEVTNDADANALVRRTYREGWTL